VGIRIKRISYWADVAVDVRKQPQTIGTTPTQNIGTLKVDVIGFI
jgi:hypothetical protein